MNTRISKDPWLAVNLSMFFPGIGQIYAGQTIRGLSFIVTQVIAIALAFWSMFSPRGNTVTALVCLCFIIGIYLGNIFDAYNCVAPQRGKKGGEKIPRKKKNPWYAMFLSRIFPGLGHLYLTKYTPAVVFFSLTFIFGLLDNYFVSLLAFTPLFTAYASAHAYIAFPHRRQLPQPFLIAVMAGFILLMGVGSNYFTYWFEHDIGLFIIPSRSMVPSLQVGDNILVKKSSKYQIQQGDIIVFEAPPEVKKLDKNVAPQTTQFYVKRAIAKPGQTVEIKDGLVYINGQPQEEKYIAEAPKYQWGPADVPAHSYFVLGDNRNKSFDSHIWGFLPERYLVGRADKIYWPPERIMPLENSEHVP